MKRSIVSLVTAVSFLMTIPCPVYAADAEEIIQGNEQEGIDYSDPMNWAFWNSGEDKEADLFIVCPTVDMGKDGNYNSDISTGKMKSKFDGALNMELGIYTDTAAVYSPYYRQAAFPVYSLGEDEREQYLDIAYDDVRDAFLYYCDNCDDSRPLILAGFSQGSDMIIRLMTEFFDDEIYSQRLVAAYAIGWSLTGEQTEQSPWLKPAQGEEDTGVIVMFNSEAEHIASSLIVGEDEHTYSINPLNWRTDSTPADKSLNKGACFTDYDGNITSEIPELTGAYIDEKRGTLKVPDISEADYPAALFDEGIFHIYDYQFFYRNLQENVAKRTAAYLAEHENGQVSALTEEIGYTSAEENEKSGDIVILYTNDVHCSIEDNIGYDGLALYKREMQEEYENVFLVDAGDAIQGAPIGTLSNGGYITRIMNALDYDAAALGNHEFDYGMTELTMRDGELDCGYICANLYDLRTGELLFEPYKIVEADGTKIAFVGAATPESMSKSTPIFFQNDEGEYIYGFGEDGSLYELLQSAVDDVRADGADYVILLAHLGENGVTEGWSAPEVAARLSGIDAVIDGHSHEVTPGITVKSKDGRDVIITQTGTKLANIGKMTITADGEIKTELVDTVPAPDESSGIAEDSWLEPEDREGRFADEAVNLLMTQIESEFDEILDEKIGHSDFDLLITDPETGIRRVRSGETNLGDLCADAYKNVLGAEVGIINAGGVRVSVEAGDITYREAMTVFPFGNMPTLAEVTGRQLLDALEAGAMNYPEENGSFIQVSGIEYTIDESVPTGVRVDETGRFIGVSGEYRVKNVLINGEPLDTAKTYTLAAHDYFLKNGGDGYIFSDNCTILKENMMTDAELLMMYIRDDLGGVILERYRDPYGEGRIKIVDGAAAPDDNVQNNDTPAENPATGSDIQPVAVLIFLAAAVLSVKRETSAARGKR